MIFSAYKPRNGIAGSYGMVVLSFLRIFHTVFQGFPGDSVDKEPACNAGDAGDTGLTPGLGGSPGGGHGNPLQYSCLENPTDRGAGRLQSIGRKESDPTDATEPTAHILFSMVVIPMHIPVNSVEETPLLHILSRIYCLSFWMMVILTGVT